jgi:hypothetical protein
MFSNYIMLLKDIETLDPSFDADKEYSEISKMVKVKVNENDNSIKISLCNDKDITFNIVSTSLKHIEWSGIPDKIKEDIQKQLYCDGITCCKAMKIIQDHKKEGVILEDKDAYYKLCLQDKRLPIDPYQSYHDFPGWIEYLGIDRTKYYGLLCDCKNAINMIIKNNYNEIKILGHDLNGIYNYCRKMDTMIPPMVCEFYKDQKLDNVNQLINSFHFKKNINYFK